MYLTITKSKEEIEKILNHKYNLCPNCSKRGAEFIRQEMEHNNFARILLSFAMNGIVVEISDFVVGECPLIMN